MARIPYLSESDVEEADRGLLARGLNLYYALVHSPGTAQRLADLALHLRHRSKLDPRLRELAILQVGYTTRTAYEWAHHVEIGLAAGLSGDDVRAIARETRGEATHLAALERAVLAAARDLARGPAIADDTYATLARALDPERLVDLVVVTSLYCGVARILGSLRIDLEEPYRKILADFPLPS